MRVVPFTHGGAVAHRVTLSGSPRSFSAWFKADGTMEDCEARDGRPVGSMQRKALGAMGKHVIKLARVQK